MLRLLFAWLRLHGDARAVARGRYGQRLVRRHAHRQLGRWMRKGGL